MNSHQTLLTKPKNSKSSRKVGTFNHKKYTLYVFLQQDLLQTTYDTKVVKSRKNYASLFVLQSTCIANVLQQNRLKKNGVFKQKKDTQNHLGATTFH